MSSFYERLSKIPDEVVIIDPKNIFCDEEFCYATENYKSFYFDNNHLSIYGATKVVNLIRAQDQK